MDLLFAISFRFQMPRRCWIVSLALIAIFLFEYYSIMTVHGMTASPSKTKEGNQEVPKSGTTNGTTNGNMIQIKNRKLNGTPDHGHFFTLGTYAAVGFLVALLAGLVLIMVFLVVKYRIFRSQSNPGDGQANRVEPQREMVPPAVMHQQAAAHKRITWVKDVKLTREMSSLEREIHSAPSVLN